MPGADGASQRFHNGFDDGEADAPILHLGEAYGVPGRFLDPGRFRTKLTPEMRQIFEKTGVSAPPKILQIG